MISSSLSAWSAAADAWESSCAEASSEAPARVQRLGERLDVRGQPVGLSLEAVVCHDNRASRKSRTFLSLRSTLGAQ